MYERAGADEGIVPLACRKREYARALPSAGRAVASAQASEQHPQQQRTERPCSAIFRARDCFGGGRIRPPASLPHYPPRRGRTNTPFPFVLESPIYKSFRRKKPAPALHTAIYHTRRKRRLTAAVRLCKNGRPSSICFALCLSCSPKHAQLEPPAKKRRSVQKPRRHARQNLPPPPSARTAHARRTTRTSYSSYGRPT